MAKQGSKIDTSTRLDIYLDYMKTGNYQKTADKFDVTNNSVKNIVKELNKNENLSKLFTQKKEEQVKDTLEEFEELGKVKNNILHNSLNEIARRILKDMKEPDIDKKKLSATQLATIYGVIIDKEFRYKELSLNEKSNNEMEDLSKIFSKFAIGDKEDVNGQDNNTIPKA